MSTTVSRRRPKNQRPATRAKANGLLNPRYVVDKENRPVGVILDIATFAEIQEIIEDYGLGNLMKELEHEEPMSLEESKRYYAKLKKRK